MTVTGSDEAANGRGTSERKRRANAANAQRSTGPRSAEGKARSSMNAVRHGMWANHVMPISKGEFQENPADFTGFVGAILDDLAPRDALEYAQATRVAMCTCGCSARPGSRPRFCPAHLWARTEPRLRRATTSSSCTSACSTASSIG